MSIVTWKHYRLFWPHIKKRGIKEIICLGDVIGYGPNPIECLEIIMENVQICLKGNHDEAFVEGVCFFNPIAKSAIEWSQTVFSESDHPDKVGMEEFLKNLPLSYTMENNFFVHASPLDPTSDYVLPRNVMTEKNKF